MNDQLFPVMYDARTDKAGPTHIPWSLADRAYSIYAARYGKNNQSLERMAERGGFWAHELDELVPGWRDEVSELKAAEREAAELKVLFECRDRQGAESLARAVRAESALATIIAREKQNCRICGGKGTTWQNYDEYGIADSKRVPCPLCVKRDAVLASLRADVSPNTDSALIELLAAWDHQAWAHWTAYMLDRLTPENIERWRRQIATPYADLTEDEKESDRKEAREILVVIQSRVQR